MTTRKLTPEDVDKIAELDDVRRTHFFRDPMRPDPRFVRTHRRVTPEERKAKGRLRTARWRSSMDQRKAPTAEQVAMAMVVALTTMPNVGLLSEEDVAIVRRAFAYLRANGFDVEEAKSTLRRMRTRLVDPLDRQGEESEFCGPPIRPDAWGPALF
ncbi:hypothetical protein [Bradyrhizobium sp. WSM1253]|uniref:hypothetical protein n=1 Tax=Bradyrhizobium sp. WSM1253 TaxID=319003 RepID=UPI00025D3040|nr:hypothetical protein [Bradyrhizobium sp. WSM1253]EIG62804.1 hypothetical protein Bra1253DRAFT_07740 [Bradyrhizobium sp. WSM1253]